MKYPRLRLLQFARYPRLGQVKTRLSPHLGDQAILELHSTLVRRCYQTLVTSNLAPVDMWCAGSNGLGEEDFFAGLGVPRCYQQQGCDLGERMHNGFVQTLIPEGEALGAVLVGSDCPLLRADILEQACEALMAGTDAVFGPAVDGGYYLVALRRPCVALFENIPWGTCDVYAKTLQKLSLLGWQYRELEPLADIDCPADLHILEKIPEFSLVKI